MKKTHTSILILFAVSAIGLFSSGCRDQSSEAGGDGASQQAPATDMSDNLDLTVVVALFGESENLEDFERKLNEPERQISNLDLNEDGEVDYLRVVESSADGTHLVSVQAVVGEDMYQDVATFDVEKDSQGQTQVQVVGAPYVYGPNYVVRPIYQTPPLITALFWATVYHAWRSPYSWGRYPSYYRPCRPISHYDYRRRVSHYRHPHVTYGYRSGKRSKNAEKLYRKSKRNDYASKHARKSFDKRNKGVKNRYELTQKREKSKGKNGIDKKRPAVAPRPSGKPSAQPSKKPSGGKPATRPSGKPSAQPSKKPSGGKPAKKPSGGKSAKKPAGKPSKGR